jgi:mannose-6-phosphate isomerase-like protein (cupin superfamily)
VADSEMARYPRTIDDQGKRNGPDCWIAAVGAPRQRVWQSIITTMSDTNTYPYETRLNIHYQPLELIEEKAIADACTYKWYNETLCQVNGSVVRMGVVQGEYHWHKHDDDDEFFYVVEGELLIDLRDSDGRERTVTLAPRQGFVVPKGFLHRTRANVRTVILMVENAGIIPTGN